MMYRSYHAGSGASDEEPPRPRRRARRNRARRAEAADGEVPEKPRKPEKTALIAAVDILARQEYSEAKLYEKLARKGYRDEEIEGAIARLKERRYLNDAEACARQFAFLYTESRNSVRQICLKLRQRGFTKEDIDACKPRDTYEREKQAALRVLALKYPHDADRQKMMANLYQKGFEAGTARDAVELYRSQGAGDGEA
ncbi:regulatory protein RecX [Mitsuokella sp. UBA4253]|uniref:regulatory protein RecX n=1 Tax=Mitsuokella sp. UBA4253 TaxID=1946959 RepID=UPI00257BECED|nr:regulatory protein RecX [Mitsuokella sp. UBA4253]